MRWAISLSLAVAVLLAGTWLLATFWQPARSLAGDAVAGLFPGFGPGSLRPGSFGPDGLSPGSFGPDGLSRGHGVPAPAETAGGDGRPAPPSDGQPVEPPPATSGGEGSTIRPDLEALLASADPAEAVRGLARLRSLAFSSGNFGLLDAVNAPESAAAASDGRLSKQLSASGHILAGFSTSLTRIETTAGSSPARAVVAITAESSAYREVDGNGATVAEVPAASEHRLHLVLVPVAGRWRIQDVLPPGA